MRLLVLGVFAASTLHAQQPALFTDPGRAEKVATTAAAVEQVFRDYAGLQHLPGLAYGVMLDGKLVYSGGIGLANLDLGIPADTRSLFRIASMSKSFTALAILQLRDAGALDLDDPVSKYLPEIENLTPLTTDAPEITIRHLLTHSAGFPEDNPWGDRQLADSDEDLRALVSGGISFSNVPGIEYEYSNLGFALLGQIVQVVSGMEFQEYMAEHIFEPLGMRSTVWEYDRAPADRLALGYDWLDESWVNIPLEHHGSFGAMGGLITSIEDFAAYVALHLSAWPPRSDPDDGPLRRSSLREMHQQWRFSSLIPDFRYPNGRPCPSVTAYAYGLRWMRDCEGKVNIGHSGGLPGFGSNWTMMPDYGLAVMSFDNRTYGGTSTLNLAVLDTILMLTGLEPRQLPVSDILAQRKNDLVALLPDWEGAERAGVFAENFFLDNRLQDLVARTRDLYAKAGTIRGVGELTPMNQLRGTFTLEGEGQDIRVFFTLTPEKIPLIQQVRMESVAH
ncbi:MAG: beta-lactamase family protein [Gemmatimonadales bacterium]|nr:beta-lactamase family protein [Gemmatimonadales bacterium]